LLTLALLAAPAPLLAVVAVPVAAQDMVRFVPAQPLTEARIAALPPAQQPMWRAYLARSQRLMAADKAALAAERAGAAAPEAVSHGRSGGGGMPLDQPAAWYGGAAARLVADNIVSFQTPAGGWGKNQDRDGPPRQRGQAYTATDVPGAARDIAGPANWAFVGTIDNNATILELRFLARVIAATPGGGAPYRTAFQRGVDYLLGAQYPNGGWPQVFPLMGGYHDAVTFNDDAIAQVIELLRDVGARTGDFAFVDAILAGRARAAAVRGYDLVVATQVQVNGRPTIWGQQHDVLTLAPTAARNFEPAALSSEESAGLLSLLMRVPDPSPRMVAAVHAGAIWLRDHAVPDVVWMREGTEGPHLERRTGAGPLWPRFYDIATATPIFGDRDRLVRTDVNAISLERRKGYKWWGTGPAAVLKRYDRWAAAHPR
jgi:PelA/Pel-15E family pectate lyase